MIEAKEIKVMQNRMKVDTESKMPNYRTKVNEEIANPVVCPRCVDEIYSLGVSLQNYIGSIYLELTVLNKGPKKNLYTNLALNQLVVKKEIEKLANDNLNRLLAYFYDNGGPIMEVPVSEKLAKEIQPFFNRIVNSFLNQVDFLVNRTSKGEMSANDLNIEINNHIISMYTAMGKLFQVDEMQNAFNELINVREI
ncbi:MAG: hypothetical protein ABFC94_18455 [Syntrophomonas sp.]